MSNSNVVTIEDEYAARYPALITTEQAAEIAQVSLLTIYAWSSAGQFDGFKSRTGRQIRLERDKFVRFLRNIDDEHA